MHGEGSERFCGFPLEALVRHFVVLTLITLIKISRNYNLVKHRINALINREIFSLEISFLEIFKLICKPGGNYFSLFKPTIEVRNLFLGIQLQFSLPQDSVRRNLNQKANLFHLINISCMIGVAAHAMLPENNARRLRAT